MSGWIVKRGERETPIPDEATLRRWANEGRFNSSDLIFHPKLQRWLYANEVLEIKEVVEKRHSSTPTVAKEQPSQTTPQNTGPTTHFVISQDGQQFQCPNVATLQHWADEGRVKPESYVFHPLLQRWIVAREVSELQPTYARTDNIAKLARNYRQLVLLVGGQLVIYVAFQFANSALRSPLLTLLFLVLILISVVALAVYAYRTAEALGSRFAPLWAVAMLVPCVNVITLFILSSKATAMCKARGIPVGFLGPQI